MSKIFRSFYFRWFLVGLLIRLILSPITIHPDLLSLAFSSYFFAYGGVINIYDHLLSMPETSDLAKNFGTQIFIYPPLAFFTLGTFMFILKPLYSSIYIPWLIANISELFKNHEIFRFALIFKLQYLLFDFGTAFLLTRLFTEEKKKRIVFIFWMLNPFSLYVSFILGHFDIMPTFFVVLALFYLFKKKTNWAALSLGIGGALKLYPALFLPIVIFTEKSLPQKVKTAIFGFLPIIVSWLPFLPSPGFKSLFLFSPFNQKMLFLRLPVTGAEYLAPFIVVYILIILHAAYFAIGKAEILWKYFLAILFLFFSVTSYHPQWVLWLTPFAIYALVATNFRYLWLWSIIFVCLTTIIFFFEASLTYGAFAPLIPSLAKAPSLADFISKFYDVFQLKSIIRSIFAAVAIFIVIKIFANEKSRNRD